MTTKVNTFPHPRAVRPGTIQIIIEIDPIRQISTLKTSHPMGIPLIMDTLLGQLHTTWKNWMQSMSKGIVNPSNPLGVGNLNTDPPPTDSLTIETLPDGDNGGVD
jgi:hypothetical protein